MATYLLLFDLDQDGSYEYDATEDVLNLSWGWGRDTELDDVSVSNLRFQMYSEAGKYEPGRASSPLYPNWKVGRGLHFQVNVLGTWYTLFKGQLTEVHYEATDQHDRLVDCQAENDMSWTTRKDVYVNMLEQQRFSPTFLNAIMDQTGYTGTREFGTSVINEFLWWADGPAINAIREITDAERGLFFVTPDGTAVYQHRHYRATDIRATTSQVTFDDGELTTFNLESISRDIYTKVTVASTARTASELETLWSLEDDGEGGVPYSLNANQTKVFDIQFSSPAFDIVTPVEGTHYAIVSAKPGGGWYAPELAPDISLDVLLEVKPQGAKLTLTAGDENISITYFRITGRLLVEKSEEEKTTEDEDSEFQFNHLHLTPRFLMNSHVAQGMAEGLLERYNQENYRVRASVDVTEDTLLQQILPRRISDRVTITIPESGIATDYYIEKIEHEVRSNDSDYVHAITMDFTPVRPDDYVWVLGTGELGDTTGLTNTALGW